MHFACCLKMIDHAINLNVDLFWYFNPGSLSLQSKMTWFDASGRKKEKKKCLCQNKRYQLYPTWDLNADSPRYPGLLGLLPEGLKHVFDLKTKKQNKTKQKNRKTFLSSVMKDHKSYPRSQMLSTGGDVNLWQAKKKKKKKKKKH